MKLKKRFYLVILTCLLVVLCPLCLGASSLPEEETTSSTDPTETIEVTEEETIADDWNTQVKEWFANILGGLSIGLDALLLALLSKKDKQKVSVTVDDANTQAKLDALTAENANLQAILVDAVQLQKGTFEVLMALYENNKGVDLNVREVIAAIHTNAEDIIKDVNQILDAETHKKVKTSIDNISHIILG